MLKKEKQSPCTLQTLVLVGKGVNRTPKSSLRLHRSDPNPDRDFEILTLGRSQTGQNLGFVGQNVRSRDQTG